jgi:TorA maturation chaperone TorD
MELFRALAVIAEPPTEEARRVAEALELGALPTADEYTELFIFQLYPYASVYLGAEGMMGGEALDAIGGFWRALGEMPPAEADHLSVMLALYARLFELECAESEARRSDLWRRARKAYLWEHLLSWLPVYLSKLANLAQPFYRRWGEILLEALLAESITLGQQETLPLHLRESPGLIDPRRREQDAEAFCQSILTPQRSGMILCRADLTKAGRKLGIGLRMGERKFILKTLLAQDAAAVFDWLIEEAALWTKRHREHKQALGQVSLVWEERSKAAASLLKELRASAQETA